jgi:hypothetical protein
MRALSAADVLRVWEQGATRAPLERALLLLSAVEPDAPPAALAALPIAARDRRLLALRLATFGRSMAVVARCPRCAEELECAVDAQELGAAAAEAPSPGEYEWRSGDAVVRYRLPDSRDLAAVDGCSPEEGERLLVERCVVDATLAGATVPAALLPPEIASALAEAMGDADANGETTIALRCPACGHAFSMLFDALTLLWADVTRKARRLLQEVDALARAYGWREEDVLALPARRRALYLEMVTG